MPSTPALLGTAVISLIGSAAAIAGHHHEKGGAFEWIGTFDVMAGNGSAVAEIVDVSPDNRQLVYTDAENGAIGFVDISRADRPRGQGTLTVGGEPTSLVVRGPWVLVGVNTSASFTQPSGRLVVVNRYRRAIVASYELDGQPDSLALAPDGKRAVIVIENERDEDLADGLLPQAPSGGVLIVDLRGPVWRWRIRAADLSPVAANAVNGSDLEPEFVDINRQNEAVVSFQENNHLAVIDIVSGRTIHQFSAGAAALDDIDTREDDLISLDSSVLKRREPDAVAWIDDDSFATANEGDYEDEAGEQGGSRGFTIFNQDGTVEFESGAAFEHWLVAAGHYNESRSENKGVEPEAVEVGRFFGRNLLFVGSERSNAVGVYDVSGGAAVAVQLLPTGIGPEGLKALPRRGLFVAATETAEADIGIPTMINLYQLRRRPSRYPTIESGADAAGLPIPWVALSGLAADPVEAKTLYAVSDAFLAQGFVYTVDVSDSPARIVDRVAVSGASAELDLEGIAVGPDGDLWLGSEGDAANRPNLILRVDPASGVVIEEVGLPDDLVDARRSNGIEGIAVTGGPGAEVIYVAIQRAWPDEGDTDGVNTKIGRYDVASKTWQFVHYPLEPQGAGDWIGLSELTVLPDGTFAVIERDKGWGSTTGFVAEVKRIYGVDLAGAAFRAFDDPAGLSTVEKTLLLDLLPDLEAASIWTTEKLEGLAVAADGRAYAVTDNDGVDGATGETVFLSLGKVFAQEARRKRRH